MHKVDPMEILLSDIFDKVFYKVNPNAKPCDYCDGEGEVDIEVFIPHNVERDVGVIDHKRVECPECHGSREMEVEDE